MHQRTLRVPKRDAERRRRHSHAERGNDQHDQQSVGTLINAAEVDRLEAAIDRWNEDVGPLENFILPGGSALIAQAHVCRSLARSAERRCQQLNAVEPLEGVGLAYINRLSDLLFVAARVIAKRQGVAEVLWQAAAKPH